MYLLRRNFLFFLLVAIVYIPFQAVAGAEYQNHPNYTIAVTGTTPEVSQSVLGGSAATGASQSFSGGAPVETPNDVHISFTDYPTTIKTSGTPGTVGLFDSTLNINDGTFTLSDEQGAARIDLYNTTFGNNTVNTDNFKLFLTGNTVNVGNDANYGVHLQGVGPLFGALFNATNMTMGAGSVSNNSVIFGSKTSTESSISIIGGAASIYSYNSNLSGKSTVNNNTVEISTGGNYHIKSDIYGGYSETILTETYGQTYNLTNTVDSNQVTLNNGKFYGMIVGGEAVIATENRTISNSTFDGEVKNNQITINNGKFYNTVLIGGRASVEGAGFSTNNTYNTNLAIDVKENKITINGGEFHDSLIIGGMATNPVYTKGTSGTVTGNTIEISNWSTDSENVYLFGGYSSGSGAVSGNTLSLKTTGVKVDGVANFDTYQFDVSNATNGNTFLTVTNNDGLGNSFFNQYEKIYNPSNPINVDNATIQWTDSSLPEQGRPSNLKVGHTLTLINYASGNDLQGTIANNGVQTDIVSSGDTYSYKVVQSGNKIYLLHNGFDTSSAWNQNINLSAPEFVGGDIFMNVGALTAPSITVTGSDFASASLHATSLNVSDDTTLTLNKTSAEQVKFDNIIIADGKKLTKDGTGLYTFDNMTINGSGSVSSLDAMSANSTVTLAGGATPTFDQINLGNGGQLTISGGTYDFNSFNVYGNGNTLQGDLNATGKSISFYLADTTQATDTALTVNGDANVTDSTIHVGITGNSSPLQKDDSLVLLQSTTLTGTPATLTGVGMQGLFLSYDFDVEAVGNQLVATVTKAGLNEESKVFSEGRAATLSFVGEGGNFAASEAVESALKAAALREDQSLALFTAFGGGQSRYETGSHVKTNGWNATVGLSHDVTMFSLETVLASFIEYGKGDYHSYNSFASGSLKGTGNTEYIGLGILGNWIDPEDNTYFNMSLRVGKVSSDFASNVFFANQSASYDYSTVYYGGHLGGGYFYELTNGLTLDLYTRFMLTQQQGKKVSVSSGDNLRFSDSLSSRLRAGVKTDLNLFESWKTTLGAAYDYEFEGKAKASAYNMSWDAPSLQGGTGVGEVSISYAHGSWSFGVGAEGYIGERRGFSGNVQFGHKF